MTNLFFYGSLRDRDLLRIVLGDDDARVSLIEATLSDHAVHWAKGQSFPMIVPSRGETAKGLLALGLTPLDIDRLNFYEGGFDYDLRAITVDTDEGAQDCQIYWPPQGTILAGDPWLLRDWQRDWGAISREAAVEAMRYHGKIDVSVLVRRFPMIRARAASRLRAAAQPTPTDLRSGMTSADVTKEAVEREYVGFYALDAMQLRHRKFDGAHSNLLNREVFVGCDAAIVLPYDPVSDRLLLVEQFRMGPTGRHDPVPWCLEPVAGLIDPGEDPETCAIREAKEEADLDLHTLEFVSKGYSSPGASSEYFFLYVGLCTLPESQSKIGGVVDEGEDIRSHILGFSDAMRLVDSGEINVIPTVLCLNWLARHRDRIRRAS